MWHLEGANARVARMRKPVLAVVALLCLASAPAALFLRGGSPPSLAVPLPPPASPPASSSAPEEAAAPPANPRAPDLPTVDVAPRVVHTVPEEDTPAPRVTLFDRNGKEITPRRTASAPATAPPPLATVSPSAPFAGPAQATGGAVLDVGGRVVRLYGVRSADPRDQCSLGPGDARNCADVARDALAQRLRRYPNVSCHVPGGQRGDPAAVCIDATGTDLGAFLIAEGLALANIGESFDYFGPEGVARAFHRGLWRYR